MSDLGAPIPLHTCVQGGIDKPDLNETTATETPSTTPSWHQWCRSLGLDADEVTYEMLCTTGVSPLFEVALPRGEAVGCKREREDDDEERTADLAASPERKLMTLEEVRYHSSFALSSLIPEQEEENEEEGVPTEKNKKKDETQEGETATVLPIPETDVPDATKFSSPSFDVDVEVDITDDVRLCNLVTVLPRRFPLERLMQQIVPTVSYDCRREAEDKKQQQQQQQQEEKEEQEMERANPEALRTDDTSPHLSASVHATDKQVADSKENEEEGVRASGGEQPSTHILPLLRAAQRQHLFSHICSSAQKTRFRHLLNTSSTVPPYQLYQQRVGTFLVTMSPEERKQLTSRIFHVFQSRTPLHPAQWTAAPHTSAVSSSSSSSSPSAAADASMMMMKANPTVMNQAAEEWEIHATLWRSLLTSSSDSDDLSPTTTTITQDLSSLCSNEGTGLENFSFSILLNAHLEQVMDDMWNAFQQEETAWNATRSATGIVPSSAAPNPPTFVGTPSYALVEWDTGDVDITSDVEGLAREQRVRMERTYYLPPTTSISDSTTTASSLQENNLSNGGRFEFCKPPTVLQDTVVEQIKRLRNYYEERRGYLHKEKILDEAHPPEPSCRAALTHPCGCIRCGRWFPRFAQWQQHRSSVDDHVLQYMDYLLTCSTRHLSKKMGYTRALRWMTKRPTSAQKEYGSGEINPGLFFPYMNKRRGQIMDEAKQRQQFGATLNGATNYTSQKDVDFASILMRLCSFVSVKTASGGLGTTKWKNNRQRLSLLASVLYGSTGNVVEIQNVEEQVQREMDSELACFHDSVLDELVLIGLERRNPHVPYHTILCPPSEALMHLVAERLEEVLIFYRTRRSGLGVFGGSGAEACSSAPSSACSSKVESGDTALSSLVRQAFSAEGQFWKFFDVMMYTVEVFFFRHHGGLRPRQREILLDMCSRVCPPSQSHYYAYAQSMKVGMDGNPQEGGNKVVLPSQDVIDNGSLYLLFSAVALFHLTAIIQRSTADLTSLCLSAATRILHQRTFIMYDLIRSAYPFSSPPTSHLGPHTAGMEAPSSGNAVGAVTPQQYQRYAEWFTRNPSPGGILQALSRSSLWSRAIRDRFSVWLQPRGQEEKGKQGEATDMEGEEPPQWRMGNGSRSPASPALTAVDPVSPVSLADSSSDTSRGTPPSRPSSFSSFSSCHLLTEFALLTPDFFPRLAQWLEGGSAATASAPASQRKNGPPVKTENEVLHNNVKSSTSLEKGANAHPSMSIPAADAFNPRMAPLLVENEWTNSSLWDKEEEEVAVKGSSASSGATPPYYQLYPCEEVPLYQVPARLLANSTGATGNHHHHHHHNNNNGENGPRAALSTVVEVLQQTGRTMTWWELDDFVTHLKDSSASASSSHHHHHYAAPVHSPTTGGNGGKNSKPATYAKRRRSHEAGMTTRTVSEMTRAPSVPAGESSQGSSTVSSQPAPKRRGRPPKAKT